VVCTVAALIVLVLARTQEPVVEEARAWLADTAAPLMEVVAGPVAEVRRIGDGVRSYLSLYEENQLLKEEITALRAAQRDLATLRRKVQRYEELLKIPAEAAEQSVAARVIADASGPFVQTVLVNAGRAQGVTKGQAVVDERGLLGRVINLGNRSARVLLLTDLNSRIPVLIEGANLKAILVGDNTGKPVLEYLPPGSRITVGARVVTTPDGGAFPPGVPVGAIAAGSRTPRVELFTAEGRADFVRILRYTAPVDVDETPDPAAPAPPATNKPTSAPSPSPAPASPQARATSPQPT
jgi:rod shape-determining protein MreC